MRNIFLLSLTLLLFSGCDLFKSEGEIKREMQITKEKMSKAQEIEKMKIASQELKALSQTEKELEAKKSLALIEKDKVLEIKRLEVALKTKELEIEKAKAKAKLENEAQIQEQNNKLRLEQYAFALLALLMIVISFFIFYYFKKRREDKLRAYNDNLEKYFHQKEEAARIKIAEKLLDTIATGKLNKDQENRLIAVFHADKNETFSQESEVIDEDVEILEIEEKKA